MTDLLTRIEQNQPVEAQELYDYIVEAIVKQGRPSVGDNDRCLYRGPDGLKCAAGHVIPDSMYSENMEGKDVHSLMCKKQMPKSLIPHEKLLRAMQSAHDGTKPAEDDDLPFIAFFQHKANTLAASLNLKPYGDKT